MFGGYSPENREKGDIRALWRMLGIDFSDGGDNDEFSPMAGPQASGGTEKIVWQRYNPYPKFGDMIDPELVFIDHGCGAKDPFCESDPNPAGSKSSADPNAKFQPDPISSKLQHMFFPGPGFIEDTPDVVKHMIAKWHNRQYAKQLEKAGKDLSAKVEKAEKEQNEEAFNDAVTLLTENDEEFNEVSTGGAGKKTIRPDQVADNATLTALLKDLELTAAESAAAMTQLQQDLQNRFPIRASGEGLSPEVAGLEAGLLNLKTVQGALDYAKGIVALQIKGREFVPLVRTASEGVGTIPVSRMAEARRDSLNLRSLYYQPSEKHPFILAAHIKGTAQGAAAPMNVVLAADIEMISDQFFVWRERGAMPGQDINFDFDNVTFVLNALDDLAGDTRFLELRKRRPKHRTLESFEAHTAEATTETAQARKKASETHDQNIKKVVESTEAKMKMAVRKYKKEHSDPLTLGQFMAEQSLKLKRTLDEKKEENHQQYSEEMRTINDEQERKIARLQGTYKLWAVLIPPIPPLLVAGFVFLNRRSKEREGVSSKRLR
jgi:hypothetical protein